MNAAKQQQKMVPNNKENESTLSNKAPSHLVTDTKSKQQVSEALQTTVDTKATTNEKSTMPNQRYGDSNVKSSAMLMTGGFDNQSNHSVQHQEQEMPFYLTGSKYASTDEDVETFQRRLDTMIVNFRSETLSEFIKSKKQVLSDQSQTIDAERRRCNTLLGVKQNEIEQLKEGLASKTKMCDELTARCEGMAFWAGKSKMLLRIKLLQHKAFDSLRMYRDFKKHSKKLLEHRMRQYRENVKREVFQGWGRQYKEWKKVKNREDFEKAVKLELQSICSQYNKEIESLRDKLNDAQSIVDSEHRNKALMQENLKKAFMRGVCALNFEAMNILNPADQGYQQQIEREMERQVINAMNSVAEHTPFNNSAEVNKHRNNVDVAPFQSYYSQDQYLQSPQSAHTQDSGKQHFERIEPNPFAQTLAEPTAQNTFEYKKVESKDSLWKPAPIMGREINQIQVPASFTYSQPTITSQLRHNAPAQPVLSSHFNRVQQTYNSDLTSVIPTSMVQPTVVTKVVEEDTSKRTLPGNPTTIMNSSSLPDFVSQGINSSNQEGKTIVVQGAGANNQGAANHTKGKATSKLTSSTVKKSAK